MNTRLLVWPFTSISPPPPCGLSRSLQQGGCSERLIPTPVGLQWRQLKVSDAEGHWRRESQFEQCGGRAGWSVRTRPRHVANTVLLVQGELWWWWRRTNVLSIRRRNTEICFTMLGFSCLQSCQLFKKPWSEILSGDQNVAAHAATHVGGYNIRKFELIWRCRPTHVVPRILAWQRSFYETSLRP